MALRFAVSMLAALPAVMGQLTPLKPSEDPFYQPPAGFEAQAPGAILRTRQVQGAFAGLLPESGIGIKTFQLLYRTTASNGSAISTATTVFKPSNSKNDRFVSFHTAYDGATTNCNPSYTYQMLADPTDEDAFTAAEMLIIQAYIFSGYIVSSPDYEGPEAAFGAGRMTGMAVLDSMRAVSQFREMGFTNKTPKIVGTGYSGGGLATGWAASLHPTYAMELPIQGWASGGTIANVTGELSYIDGSSVSGFSTAILDGLLKPSAYGAELQPLFDRIITPFGQGALDFANMHCPLQSLVPYAGVRVQSTSFQSEGDRLFYDPVMSAVLNRTIMGAVKQETPIVPVYLYHSQNDEVITYANASSLAERWCNYGASVQFTNLANGGHFTGEIIGFVSAFQFVESAFAGTVAKGCSRKTDLSTSMNPLALGLQLEPLLFDLLTLLVKAGRGVQFGGSNA